MIEFKVLPDMRGPSPHLKTLNHVCSHFWPCKVSDSGFQVHRLQKLGHGYLLGRHYAAHHPPTRGGPVPGPEGPHCVRAVQRCGAQEAPRSQSQKCPRSGQRTMKQEGAEGIINSLLGKSASQDQTPPPPGVMKTC